MMEPPPRIELGSSRYEGDIIPLYYGGKVYDYFSRNLVAHVGVEQTFSPYEDVVIAVILMSVVGIPRIELG